MNNKLVCQINSIFAKLQILIGSQIQITRFKHLYSQKLYIEILKKMCPWLQYNLLTIEKNYQKNKMGLLIQLFGEDVARKDLSFIKAQAIQNGDLKEIFLFMTILLKQAIKIYCNSTKTLQSTLCHIQICKKSQHQYLKSHSFLVSSYKEQKKVQNFKGLITENNSISYINISRQTYSNKKTQMSLMLTEVQDNYVQIQKNENQFTTQRFEIEKNYCSQNLKNITQLINLEKIDIEKQQKNQKKEGQTKIQKKISKLKNKLIKSKTIIKINKTHKKENILKTKFKHFKSFKNKNKLTYIISNQKKKNAQDKYKKKQDSTSSKKIIIDFKKKQLNFNKNAINLYSHLYKRISKINDPKLQKQMKKHYDVMFKKKQSIFKSDFQKKTTQRKN